MTDQLSEELECSQALVAPLLACLQGLSKQVAEAGASSPDALRLLLSNVHLVASIFYSLNSPGLTDVRQRGRLPAPPAAAAPACLRPPWPALACLLPHAHLRPALACLPPTPQAFEESLDAWMAEWHTYLTLDAPGLADSDPEKESVVDGVKAQVGAGGWGVGLPVGLVVVGGVLCMVGSVGGVGGSLPCLQALQGCRELPCHGSHGSHGSSHALTPVPRCLPPGAHSPTPVPPAGLPVPHPVHGA